MKPLKRGVTIPGDVANYAFEVARICGVLENRVYVRLLQIGHQDLTPFQGKALIRVIKDPWDVTKQLPALKRQVEKRDHGRLTTVIGTRLTLADSIALHEFLEEHKTTVSAGLRQLVHRVLATETA